jgi:hypothetical protein
MNDARDNWCDLMYVGFGGFLGALASAPGGWYAIGAMFGALAVVLVAAAAIVRMDDDDWHRRHGT